jgi:DNA-binding response OmpR family regulator
MADDRQPIVLVLEADIVVRHSLAEYLRECGYRVIEAARAAAAHTILQAPGTEVDVLFAGLGGDEEERRATFALVAWVRDALSGLKVELAGALQTAARKAGDLCEEEPLKKPYDHQLVHDRIRRLLAARARSEDED